MPPAASVYTYRLAFRALDDQVSSVDLVRMVMRALLSDAAKKVVIQSVQRPPQVDAYGLHLTAVTSGPEHWYLDLDDALLSAGLRCELQP